MSFWYLIKNYIVSDVQNLKIFNNLFRVKKSMTIKNSESVCFIKLVFATSKQYFKWFYTTS